MSSLLPSNSIAAHRAPTRADVNFSTISFTTSRGVLEHPAKESGCASFYHQTTEVVIGGTAVAGRALLAGVLWMSGLASSAWSQTAVKTTEAVVVSKKTLLQELNLPAIWFLLGCSLLIVWLVVDVFLKSGKKRLLPKEELSLARDHFSRGSYQEAFDASVARPGAWGDTLQAALRHAGDGQRAVEDAVAVALAGANARFQTKIAYLSVIGVIAPMVGLTGTVLGMIDAFSLMGQAGAADPSKLSGAIGHVLHATAGGLIVAIPAFVCYYALRNRVSHAFHEIGAAVAELFRAFPYEALSGRSFRGAEPCAAKPNWLSGVEPIPARDAQASVS